MFPYMPRMHNSFSIHNQIQLLSTLLLLLSLLLLIPTGFLAVKNCICRTKYVHTHCANIKLLYYVIKNCRPQNN